MQKKTYIKLVYVLILTGVVVCAFLLHRDKSTALAVDGHIKWVDFNATADIMHVALKCDLESYEQSKSDPSVNHAKFVELIALGATKYGGDFSRCKSADIEDFAEQLKSGTLAAEIAEGFYGGGKYFPYFLEAYSAALGGFMGNYAVYGDSELTPRYGLKVFSPIAAGYHYRDFDDYGAARQYGYRRPHLGHDLMGSVGTPIIAIESGYVEACGWNQYGGWRIGIRSFDGKRYYYYAHLRRDHPYNDIYEGKQVNAGDVIGYLGMTGYSSKENVNNIDTPHLHFGVQLIFDPSQKDGSNQIWIDLYQYTKFLSRFRQTVYFDKAKNEFYAKNPILDLDIPD